METLNYKLTNINSVVRLPDYIYIPIDVGNRDYQEYLEWLSLGNTPIPADPVQTITPQPTAEERLAALEQAILQLTLG